MKVLHVEDDPIISSFVRMGLESYDIAVDVAYDSLIGEKLAINKKYNVIILDVIIPGINGYELCKNIRNRNILTPIIFLTSMDTVEDKLRGFECGSDDYLIKPFSLQELLARIMALNRRNRDIIVKPVLQLADLKVDSVTREVSRNGKRICLTATEYKILELLLENNGRVFDRMMIAEKIWGCSFNSGTNIIDVHINSLRKKIDRDFNIKLIHTKKGFGYVLTEISLV